MPTVANAIAEAIAEWENWTPVDRRCPLPEFIACRLQVRGLLASGAVVSDTPFEDNEFIKWAKPTADGYLALLHTGPQILPPIGGVNSPKRA